jgi:hypothetical protein
VLPIIPDQVIAELTTLVVTNTATDADIPANTLTYQLLAAPEGATISAEGIITWTPTEAEGPSTNTVTVKVTDDGSPALSATNSFTVVVRALPNLELKAISMTDGVFTMVANGVSGQTFTLQVSPDLRSWTDLVTTNSAEATLTLQDRAAGLSGRQFYRLKRIR